jgi:hypothetical protein
MGARRVALVVALALLSAACGSGDDGDATSDTSAPVESSTTAVDTTAAMSTTTTPSTTTTTARPTTTSEAAGEALAAGDLALIVDNEINVWRTAESDFGDLVTDEFSDFLPYDVELAADRSSMYVSVGYEDSWYSCDQIMGTVEHVVVGSGASELLTAGTRPRVDPTGRYVAVLDTRSCRPDPAGSEPSAPTYIADVDTTLLFDLESGTSTEQSIGPADGTAPPFHIVDHLWLPDGRYAYLTSMGQYVVTDLVGGGTLDQPGVTWPFAADTSVQVSLAGIDREGRMLALVRPVDLTAPRRLVAVDPATGAELATVATAAGPDVWAKVDSDGRLLMGNEGELTIDGTAVDVPPVNEYGTGYVWAADG